MKKNCVHEDIEQNNKFQAIFQKREPVHRVDKKEQMWVDVSNNIKSNLFVKNTLEEK